MSDTFPLLGVSFVALNHSCEVVGKGLRCLACVVGIMPRKWIAPGTPGISDCSMENVRESLTRS